MLCESVRNEGKSPKTDDLYYKVSEARDCRFWSDDIEWNHMDDDDDVCLLVSVLNLDFSSGTPWC